MPVVLYQVAVKRVTRRLGENNTSLTIGVATI